MPDDDARHLIQLIGQKLRSDPLEPRHRDPLIRLWQTLEEDLTWRVHPPAKESKLPKEEEARRYPHATSASALPSNPLIQDGELISEPG